MTLAEQTVARLYAAGIAGDDPGWVALCEWNAAVRARRTPAVQGLGGPALTRLAPGRAPYQMAGVGVPRPGMNSTERETR